ncbi:MAG: PQQ-binding-like beta-propeller repeat protein [Acidobacteriia bacterium]|nr:PQQ-binding-like beta-propeller repeat protein [Terriglobia bacterium]
MRRPGMFTLLLFGATLIAQSQQQGPDLPPIPNGPGGGLSPYATLPPGPAQRDLLGKLTSVTDAMLANPPAGEWLTWRRTYDDMGFSPLKQIDRANARNLRVAWSWSLPAGASEMTPLVHDGVLFVYGWGDRVQALDAATGDLLWQYSRQLPKEINLGVKRNMALYGDKLFVPTADVHMVALDIKTGRVVWDRAITDAKGFHISGGPLAARGKVMQGVAGQAAGGNYIVALDANTGQEAWRFYTIARPGEPGGESWNGLPLEKRNGASVWTAGSYDPQLNLAYFGVGQTYDTGPLLHPLNQAGVTNEGLYTDCTLAINPDTGKLAWYFQHVPNDQWDLDWAFERQLLPLPVNGTTTKVALTSGKMAIYDALDATTGKYLFSIDLGLQNVVTAIDPKTGAKTINPKTLPGDGETKLVCPHAGGAKNWNPASYNAATHMLYVPLVESCMDLIPVAQGARGSLSSGVRWTIRPRLDSDGKFGRLMAIDLVTHKPVWTERQRIPITTGALDTAGGVLFEGSMDRWFRARDDSNGKVLWDIRLNDVPNSAPISYTANGKQYVAITVGNGGAIPMTWAPFFPDMRNPSGGAAVWAFEVR